jgi:hypothetical protein
MPAAVAIGWNPFSFEFLGGSAYGCEVRLSELFTASYYNLGASVVLDSEEGSELRRQTVQEFLEYLRLQGDRRTW